MRHLVGPYWSDLYGRTMTNTGNGVRDATAEERQDAMAQLKAKNRVPHWPYCCGCQVCDPRPAM